MNKEAKIVWEPNPGPQASLISSPVPEIFFGGARGGGKTDGLLGDFATHAGEHGENARGIIFRRTLPEFREIELRSQEIYNKLGAVYRRGDREWIFPNGARLVMRYLYDEHDAQNYQGHSYTWIGVDEAGNWPDPAPIDLMRGTLRSAKGVPTYMRLTGNPGGVGHLWLKSRYIDPAPPFTVHKYTPQEERPDLQITAVFIPSMLEDNPYLAGDVQYEASLAASGGPALFRAWRYGDWNAIIGAAFREWRTETHVHTIAKIDRSWRMIAGMDWGFGSPGAFYAAAINPNDGRVYFFFEHYFNEKKNEQGTPAEDVGYDIGVGLLEMMSSGVIERLPEYVSLDADSFHTKDGRGGRWTSTADLVQIGLNRALGEQTFPVIASPKGWGSRVNGKQVLHQMLKFDVDRDGNVPPHLAPKVRFHPRCVHAIRTLPALPVDPNKPEDVDTDAEDHAYDAIRYLLSARGPEILQQAQRAGTFDQHPGLNSDGRRKEQPWEKEYKSLGNIIIADRWTRITPETKRRENEVATGLPW